MWGCHTKKLVWQPCFVVSQQKNLVMQGGMQVSYRIFVQFEYLGYSLILSHLRDIVISKVKRRAK